MKTSTALVISGGVLLSVFGIQAPAATPPTQNTVQAENAPGLGGDWTAQRVGTTLTFRFERSGDAWQGWFVSRKNGQLYPLKDVVVGHGEVTFVHNSNPELKFDLTLQKDGATLSGDAEMPDGLVLPYTFTRDAAG